MTKKKIENTTPEEIAKAITGFPCTWCSRNGEVVWLKASGKCAKCGLGYCRKCGIRIGGVCEHQPAYCQSDSCEFDLVALNADGTCPECGYDPCPYCGGFDCEHVVAIEFDDEWGTRPWPNDQFTTPHPDHVNWQNPGLVTALRDFVDPSDIDEMADYGLTYRMERELPFEYDRWTHQRSNSMGGSGAGYYFAKDPDSTNKRNAAFAEEFQALLDSLPEKYPPVGEEKEQ